MGSGVASFPRRLTRVLALAIALCGLFANPAAAVTTLVPAPSAVTGGAPGISVEFRRSLPADSLEGADALFSDALIGLAGHATDNGVAVINYVDTGGGNVFPLPRDVGVPPLTGTGFVAAAEDDHFAMRATGFVKITQPGSWTFSVRSGDGERLLMGEDNKLVTVCDCLRAAATDSTTVTVPSAGVYHFELTWFQQISGAMAEFFAQGPSDPSAELVGDTANGGLEVHQELTQTATLVSSSIEPEPVGIPVTLTATLFGTAGMGSGASTIQFFDGGQPLGPALPLPASQVVSTTQTLTAGVHQITAQFSGGGQFRGSTSDPITQHVVANQAPVAAFDSYSIAANTPLTTLAPGVLANDSDAESEPLTSSLVAGPLHGTVTLNQNGSFVYKPNAAFSGLDFFTYRAVDANGQSAPAAVLVTVAPPPPCLVPKLAGKRVAAARNALAAAHCALGKVTKRKASKKKSGRVLSQKPKAGTRLPAGSRVSVVVGRR
jgi:hypothetical protein